MIFDHTESWRLWGPRSAPGKTSLPHRPLQVYEILSRRLPQCGATTDRLAHRLGYGPRCFRQSVYEPQTGAGMLPGDVHVPDVRWTAKRQPPVKRRLGFPPTRTTGRRKGSEPHELSLRTIPPCACTRRDLPLSTETYDAAGSGPVNPVPRDRGQAPPPSRTILFDIFLAGSSALWLFISRGEASEYNELGKSRASGASPRPQDRHKHAVKPPMFSLGPGPLIRPWTSGAGRMWQRH